MELEGLKHIMRRPGMVLGWGLICLLQDCEFSPSDKRLICCCPEMGLSDGKFIAWKRND
jgi:hypothetical protein